MGLLRRFAQVALVLAALAFFAFAWHCDLAWFERHVFLPQQFFIVADPRIARGARIAAVLLGVLLLLAAPFLPRGAGMRRLALAAVLALPATEALLQWRSRRLLRGDLVAAMDALTSPDPRHGVTLKPSMDREQPMSGRPIRFVTDAERRRIPGLPIDSARPSLVFTGESTVAGYGLQWDETFFALLGDRLHLQVINLASMNYRLDQSWLRLADQLPRLQHPVAVVGFFMPGLLGRAFAGEAHPLARPRGQSVEILQPAKPSFWQRTGFYRLFRHLYWSDAEIEEGTESLSAVLRQMDGLSRERGIPCVFAVTAHTPRWMIDRLFERNHLDYVVVEVPPGELLQDGHPNPQGSRRIAAAIAVRLQRRLR